MTDRKFIEVLSLMAQMRDIEDRITVELGNIKSSDIGKVLAAEARSRGMKTVMGTTKNGGHYKWSVTEPGEDKMVDDGATACKVLREMGIDVPKTTRKGAAATLRKA